MLGNDIVDLRDADAQPGSFRPRFDDRVFSSQERSQIAADPNPLARRWAHWAAKEAAYKLAKQHDSRFVFSPSRLVATYSDVHAASGDFVTHLVDGAGEPGEPREQLEGFEQREHLEGRERIGRLELPDALSCGVQMLTLRSFESEAWVHVVAAPVECDWIDVTMGVRRLDASTEDPSVAVRATAVREIGLKLDVATERLSIGRKGRIPIVLLDGSPTSYSLSLSHHGSWMSFAVRLHAHPDALADWDRRRKSVSPELARRTCVS